MVDCKTILETSKWASLCMKNKEKVDRLEGSTGWKMPSDGHGILENVQHQRWRQDGNDVFAVCHGVKTGIQVMRMHW